MAHEVAGGQTRQRTEPNFRPLNDAVLLPAPSSRPRLSTRAKVNIKSDDPTRTTEPAERCAHRQVPEDQEGVPGKLSQISVRRPAQA